MIGSFFRGHGGHLALTIVCGLILVGCGKQSAEVNVTGKVTFEGEVVPEGMITFYPSEGRAAFGEIQPNGSYKLTSNSAGGGVMPGAYQVTIEAMASSGEPEVVPSSLEEELAGPVPGTERRPRYRTKWLVPEEYSRRKTSELKATIKAGEDNTVNFDLP